MMKKKQKSHKIPVITIDGPSGVGKGTISQKISTQLSWNYLNSGALYRALALFAKKYAISINHSQKIAELAYQMDIRFTFDTKSKTDYVFLENTDITNQLQQETVGQEASILAAFTEVRVALLERQQSFRKAPGLVTDGRDMGTTIFPDADLKFYLTATKEERAKRRHLQLLKQNISVTIQSIEHEIALRDIRDQERLTSPLKMARDAIIIDTTHLAIDAVFAKVWDYVQQII